MMIQQIELNISVTVSASNFNNTSDETALTAIANAINTAMTSAVVNDTIESDEDRKCFCSK